MIERRLRDFRAPVLMLAREGDNGLERAPPLREVLLNGVEVLDRPLDTARDHHRPRLAPKLAKPDHLFVEVIDHDLGFEPDRVLVALNVPPELFPRPFHVELGVPRDRLDELVVALYRRVVVEHVQDEALLDRLLHGVAVKRSMLDLAAFVISLTKDLERLVLGRGGEGEVARVRQKLLRFHNAVDLVLKCLVVFLCSTCGQRHADGGRCAPVLARVGLVDDNGELSASVLAADLVEDKWEFLHRGDDDLLTTLNELLKVARMLGVANGGADLGKLLDGALDLLVQNTSVGDDDDRVEYLSAVLAQAD